VTDLHENNYLTKYSFSHNTIAKTRKMEMLEIIEVSDYLFSERNVS